MPTGIGFDIHPLRAGRPLVLGGVRIPYSKGLAGHSDGDALCHAVTDALLGACGAGDIGRWFSDTDPRHRGMDSARALADVWKKLSRRYALVNVDAAVVCERPRLSQCREAMERRIQTALGAARGQVNIKFKTHEQMGEIGRGRAIAVWAVAEVKKRTRRQGDKAKMRGKNH